MSIHKRGLWNCRCVLFKMCPAAEKQEQSKTVKETYRNWEHKYESNSVIISQVVKSTFIVKCIHCMCGEVICFKMENLAGKRRSVRSNRGTARAVNSGEVFVCAKGKAVFSQQLDVPFGRRFSLQMRRRDAFLERTRAARPTFYEMKCFHVFSLVKKQPGESSK